MNSFKKEKQEIPPEDNIALSPLDKYRIYGKFPLNMIVHILLVVFTSLQAMVILAKFTDYFRGKEKSLTNILISNDNKEKRDYARKIYLYDIPSLQGHLSNSLKQMLDANNTFFTNLIYVNEKNEEIQKESIEMDVEYIYNISLIKKEEYKMPINLHYNVTDE